MTRITTLLLLFVTCSFAQSKMLTLEDAVRGQRTYLAPQKLEQLGWIPGTDQYYYIGDKKDRLFIGSADKPAKAVTSLRQINEAIKKFGMGMDTVAEFPFITWTSSTAFTFEGKNRIGYDIKKGGTFGSGIREEEKNRENQDTEPNKHNVAFTRDNNLYIEEQMPGTHETQVTRDANKDIVNGKSVHREEWGISKGTFWSPRGNYLAFYRMDQTMVTDYPIINFSEQPAKDEPVKYPMAGAKSHEVTIGVYDVKSAKTIFLQTGEPKDQYLINPCWSPDENHIYVTVLNRAQDHLKMNAYNAHTGAFESTLFEEKNDKYVHPMNPPLFVKGHPDLFIWQSERDGYNNLYLYKTDGTLVRQLSNYAAPNQRRAYYTIVTEVLGFDEKGEHVIYLAANSQQILGREIRKAAVDGSSDEAITRDNGTHSAVLSPNGRYLIDNFSSAYTPRITSVFDLNGTRQQTLLTAANPLKDYQLGQIRLFTIKAADNTTDLYCRMTLPVGFDSTRKYPTIVYLYNGPNVQLITNTWLYGSDLWYQYMAEHGYIVFTVEGRGSGNRGLLFEQCTFRHLGTEEMNDQLKGVDYLKSKSYVDAERLGVFGWSYGGFMTTSLMTRHPGVFKCAVAGGPVIDWSYYEVMYTERYMDTPQENPEGYKDNSLLNYAGNLKGKLLLIHGTSDPVVVWQHSLLFLKKCVAKGTYPDYLVYPGHEHNVLGKDRTHLFYKITEYFTQNL